ncbi:hypothetical protein ACX1N5_00625 [Acinetobacter sp. ANC 4636]
MKLLKRLVKFLISLILSLVAAWLTWKYADSYLAKPHENNGPYELAKQISSIAGVILGFVLAAISILTAVMDKTLIANMVRTGHFQNFVKQAFYGCTWLMILIAVSLASLVVPEGYLKWALAVMIGVTIYTTIELFITAKRFYNIIVVMSSR